jgi:metal-responsive CopG/Arc/MetJ family transcriptional regulator
LGLENYTAFAKNITFKQEQLISQLSIFQTEQWLLSNFVLTGNARSIQTLRKVLREKNKKGRIFAKAYWAEGKTGL